MHILLVLTGGTIGSAKSDNTIATNDKAPLFLLEEFYKNHSQNDYKFTTISPFNILSENLKPHHWTKLIEAINTEALSHYDGIIITHGTDTLAYTANALSLGLHNTQLPIVLVSSHKPPFHQDSNAHINFKTACMIIKEKNSGLFISYKNPNEAFVSIYDAHEITQSPQLSSSFHPLNTLCAKMHDNYISWGEYSSSTSTMKLDPLYNEDVLYIKPYPGLDYDMFNLDNVKYVLHDLYHSGTCNEKDLIAFTKRCSLNNILLFAAPIKSSDTRYESTQHLIDAGIHFIHDISIERALVMLMQASAQLKSPIDIIDYVTNKN
jgi:glutamyl-tRNA(Gln) amidotransferase subunit D